MVAEMITYDAEKLAYYAKLHWAANVPGVTYAMLKDLNPAITVNNNSTRETNGLNAAVHVNMRIQDPKKSGHFMDLNLSINQSGTDKGELKETVTMSYSTAPESQLKNAAKNELAKNEFPEENLAFLDFSNALKNTYAEHPAARNQFPLIIGTLEAANIKHQHNRSVTSESDPHILGISIEKLAKTQTLLHAAHKKNEPVGTNVFLPKIEKTYNDKGYGASAAAYFNARELNLNIDEMRALLIKSGMQLDKPGAAQQEWANYSAAIVAVKTTAENFATSLYPNFSEEANQPIATTPPPVQTRTGKSR